MSPHPQARSRRGRRIDSRGRYLIHVLTPAGDGVDSACRKLGPAPPAKYKDEEPDHKHPLCQPCLRAAGRGSGASGALRPVTVRAAPPKPQDQGESKALSLDLAHRLVWAAHALGSANRLAIVDVLRQRGSMKAEQLRDAVGHWEGMFDLSMDALVRGRIVEIAGKRSNLTEFGRVLFERLYDACAAGLDAAGTAAPTH